MNNLKNWEEKFDNLRNDCVYSAPEIIKDRYKQFIKDFAKTLLDELEMEMKTTSPTGNIMSDSVVDGYNGAVKENNSKIKSLRDLLI